MTLQSKGSHPFWLKDLNPISLTFYSTNAIITSTSKHVYIKYINIFICTAHLPLYAIKGKWKKGVAIMNRNYMVTNKGTWLIDTLQFFRMAVNPPFTS